MALQSSGAISFANIQTEFGGSNPISLNEYYQAGTYVSEHSSTVPTSGTIDLADFYGTEKAVRIVISANTTNYNILTAATAAGYSNSTAQPIVIIVNSGVEVSGTTNNHGIRTGALHQNSDVLIICNGTISGGHGGTNTAGADAVYFETDTGGSGTYEVRNNGLIRSGGGGGGNAGVSEQYEEQDGSEYICSNTLTGAVGSTGTYNASGGSGSWHGNLTSDDIQNCAITSPGGGGAAGYAVRKNGRTVTTSGSGTYTGTVG